MFPIENQFIHSSSITRPQQVSSNCIQEIYSEELGFWIQRGKDKADITHTYESLVWKIIEQITYKTNA